MLTTYTPPAHFLRPPSATALTPQHSTGPHRLLAIIAQSPPADGLDAPNIRPVSITVAVSFVRALPPTGSVAVNSVTAPKLEHEDAATATAAPRPPLAARDMQCGRTRTVVCAGWEARGPAARSDIHTFVACGSLSFLTGHPRGPWCVLPYSLSPLSNISLVSHCPLV